MTAKTKFEQLIEFVINDEEQKAQELFHSIVVEKSREIYESLMEDEEAEEELDEETSGSASEDLVREVETDEEVCEDEEAEEEEAEGEEDFEGGEEEEAEGEEEELEGSEEELEDRVVDLEDKLDELMAEFESLMGDEEVAGDEEEFDMEPVDDEVGGDAYAMDDTSEFDDEMMNENITLAATPKPETAEPSFVNKKSTYAANAGQAGMQGKPVKNSYSETNPDGTAAYKAPTSYADKGRGDLPGAGKFKNVPAKDGSKLEPATKPTTSQAAGVNTKTPFPKG